MYIVETSAEYSQLESLDVPINCNIPKRYLTVKPAAIRLSASLDSFNDCSMGVYTIEQRQSWNLDDKVACDGAVRWLQRLNSTPHERGSIVQLEDYWNLFGQDEVDTSLLLDEKDEI